MSSLVVVAYPSLYQAEEVRLQLLKMQKEYLVDLEDAVIAVRKADGKVKLHQLYSLTAAGAVGGGFWGLLIGLIFLNPLLGVAVGAGAGAVSGALSDVGVNDEFMKNVARQLQTGHSLLFILFRGITLDKARDRDWEHHRIIDALLEYARRIKDREALIVLATDEHAMEERHITTIRRITRTHPMVLIDVATMNPFKAVSSRHAPTDGLSARRVPAFLRNVKAAAEVDTHRAYMAAALEQELTRAGSHIIRSASSESMFDRFVALVSRALARTTRNRLGTAPELVGLTLAGDL